MSVATEGFEAVRVLRKFLVRHIAAVAAVEQEILKISCIHGSKLAIGTSVMVELAEFHNVINSLRSQMP